MLDLARKDIGLALAAGGACKIPLSTGSVFVNFITSLVRKVMEKKIGQPASASYENSSKIS